MGEVTSSRPPDSAETQERSRVTADEVLWALRTNHRRAAEVDRALAQHLRLRPLEQAALTHLLDAEHPVGPAELSRRLGISTGSMTELVDRLEQLGHLHRRRDMDDRRRVLLTVTDHAVAATLGELRPLMTDLDELAAELTGEERAAVLRYLSAASALMARYVTDVAERPPEPGRRPTSRRARG